jgi:hypothetical protein
MPADNELDAKVRKLVGEFDAFMNDDFNTLKCSLVCLSWCPLLMNKG